MLAKQKSTFQLVLQIPFALVGVHLVALKINDLNRDVYTAMREGKKNISVSRRHRYVDYWRIPLVKRANLLVSEIVFMLLQAAV